LPRKNQKVLFALFALFAHIFSRTIGGIDAGCPPRVCPVKACFSIRNLNYHPALPEAIPKLINSKFELLDETKDLRTVIALFPHPKNTGTGIKKHKEHKSTKHPKPLAC
jgi:hypothetical protein